MSNLQKSEDKDRFFPYEWLKIYRQVKPHLQNLSDRELLTLYHGPLRHETDKVTVFLLVGNYGLWVKVSRGYRFDNVNEDGIIGELLLLAFTKAMDSYDPDKWVGDRGTPKLTSYICVVFENEIRMLYRHQSTGKGYHGTGAHTFCSLSLDQQLKGWEDESITYGDAIEAKDTEPKDTLTLCEWYAKKYFERVRKDTRQQNEELWELIKMGYSATEIAEIRGVTRSTVAQQWRKMREYIRNGLGY